MIRLLEDSRENLDKNYVSLGGGGREGGLIDLSKAFDWVPHDLSLAKFPAYGVDESCFCYMYSYLLNWKQRKRMNDINSDFLNVISSVPQWTIVGPILFNCLFNDFFTLLKLLMPTILETIIH